MKDRWDSLRGDVRYALRLFVRRPLLSAIVVLTLALGIGATTAIFSVVSAVLIEPLPYGEPDRLVTVWQDLTSQGGPADEWASWDNFDDWRRSATSFESMVAIGGGRPVLESQDGSPPEQLLGASATHGVFDVLGVEPVHGQRFTKSHDVAGAERVALISTRLARSLFGEGQEPSALDTVLRLNSNSVRVIGVLPERFEVPFEGEVDVLMPMAIDKSNSCGRGCVTMRVAARLAAGATLEQAQEEMATIAARLEQEYPRANQGTGSTVIPLHERVTGDVRGPLLTLMMAVGLVLLIACANVASVQLARMLARQNEFALRSAIGADRSQLVQQVMLESLLLAGLGGVLGLGLAWFGVSALRRAAGESVSRLAEAQLDPRTLLFALAATVLTGILFGILPSLRAAGMALGHRLASGAGFANTRRARSSLVVLEVALSVVLLICAGLLGRSLVELLRVDLGFDKSQTLVARVGLSGEVFRERANRFAFADGVLERLESYESVEHAALATAPPMLGVDGDTNFVIEGAATAEGERSPVAWIRGVDGGFFETVGARLLEGRVFTSRDREGSPDVVVVNEAFVGRYFPDKSPLGERIDMNGTPRWREIVGVVADMRQFGLTESDRPAAYLPWQQSPFGSPFFLVRSKGGDPLALVPALRDVVRDLHPHLAVANVTTFEEVVGDSAATERLLVGLLSLFSALALLLAALGLYGVMSHAVVSRMQEMGVRVALGATPGSVRSMILRHGATLAVVGAVIGLGFAALAVRAIESQLFGVAAFDPWVWLLVPVILIGVALVASLGPALRASSVSVLEALRES